MTINKTLKPQIDKRQLYGSLYESDFVGFTIADILEVFAKYTEIEVYLLHDTDPADDMYCVRFMLSLWVDENDPFWGDPYAEDSDVERSFCFDLTAWKDYNDWRQCHIRQADIYEAEELDSMESEYYPAELIATF